MRFSAIAAFSFLPIVSLPGSIAQPDNMDDEVVLLVRYKNDVGKGALQAQASDGKIGKDIKLFKTTTIKAKRSQIKDIGKDPNVEAISEDYPVYALPHVPGDSHERRGDRRLNENFPYGIGMVEADKLAQGPNPVKVCVVDTGYDEGHEDLPTSSEHGVDGFSPYDGQLWNNDGHGHGTHCAGTIGAIGNNGIGVTSVNPNPNKFSFSSELCQNYR